MRGASVTYDVTIEESELPATGQDMVGVWILAGLAAMILAVAGLLVRRRQKSKNSE